VSDDLASHAERLLSEADKPEMPGTPSGKLLEEWIEFTCIQAMSTAVKDTEKIAAANAAIKYLAVKAKLPVPYGAGFDE
jgi:hypothetical protein